MASRRAADHYATLGGGLAIGVACCWASGWALQRQPALQQVHNTGHRPQSRTEAVAWRKKAAVCEALHSAAEAAAAEAAAAEILVTSTRSGGQPSRPPERGDEEVTGGLPMDEAARPVFRAALCGDVDAVRALVESGSNLRSRSSRGRSLLAVLLHTPGADTATVSLLRAANLSDDCTVHAAAPQQHWICAFELYDLVLVVNPSALFALAGRQRAAAALGSHATALLDAAELLARRPDDAPMWLAKASAYEALGLFQHATTQATPTTN